MKKMESTKQLFERFFASECRLSRAEKHLAQAFDADAAPERVIANMAARALIKRWIAEICEQRTAAIAAHTRRVEARKAKVNNGQMAAARE